MYCTVGIDLSTLSQLGQGADTLSADGRKKTTEMIARHLSSVFDMQRARRHASDACTAAAARQCSRCFILCWCFDCLGTRHHGTYLTGCYLTTKLFYLLNVPRALPARPRARPPAQPPSSFSPAPPPALRLRLRLCYYH